MGGSELVMVDSEKLSKLKMSFTGNYTKFDDSQRLANVLCFAFPDFAGCPKWLISQ